MINDSVAEILQNVFHIGKHIAKSFTGFSRTEINWCQVERNWSWLYTFINSDNPYEMIIHLSLAPIQDFMQTFQLIVACLLDFGYGGCSSKLEILIQLLENEPDLDHVFKHTKLLRLLLALHSNYDKTKPRSLFSLPYNANILLAHIIQKFPDLLRMNFFRTNSKVKRLRFSQADVDFWLAKYTTDSEEARLAIDHHSA